ncbi:hypothetical protein L6Q79_03700 [bacterium]|nr:hypothetical protein [bacterium]NUN46775.1 hypothetical protein [bacterium]
MGSNPTWFDFSLFQSIRKTAVPFSSLKKSLQKSNDAVLNIPDYVWINGKKHSIKLELINHNSSELTEESLAKQAMLPPGVGVDPDFDYVYDETAEEMEVPFTLADGTVDVVHLENLDYDGANYDNENLAQASTASEAVGLDPRTEFNELTLESLPYNAIMVTLEAEENDPSVLNKGSNNSSAFEFKIKAMRLFRKYDSSADDIEILMVSGTPKDKAYANQINSESKYSTYTLPDSEKPKGTKTKIFSTPIKLLSSFNNTGLSFIENDKVAGTTYHKYTTVNNTRRYARAQYYHDLSKSVFPAQWNLHYQIWDVHDKGSKNDSFYNGDILQITPTNLNFRFGSSSEFSCPAVRDAYGNLVCDYSITFVK